MKKFICSLLLVTICINFILSSCTYAEDPYSTTEVSPTTNAFGLNFDTSGTDENNAVLSTNATTTLLEEGKTSQTQGSDPSIATNSKMAGASMIGVIMGYIALIIDLVPLEIQFVLSMLANTKANGALDQSSSSFWLTIENIVFNQVGLFNVNFFNTDDTYTVGSGSNEYEVEASFANLKIKESVSTYFMVMRMIAMIASLVILIYIGIRMAISTVATDRAKYKKMLISWVESILIMFVLPYIMVFIIGISESLTSMFYGLKQSLLSDKVGFEIEICNTITHELFNSSGLTVAMYSLMYWIIAYMQLKFFYLYIKRVLSVGFLAIISPLITITYSIDKVGDGKAQAFSIWLKEFYTNILIQPLHALLYLVFMFTAGEIAKYAPVVGIVFLMSLGQAEKMVKVIFNVNKTRSLRGLNDFRRKKK